MSHLIELLGGPRDGAKLTLQNMPGPELMVAVPGWPPLRYRDANGHEVETRALLVYRGPLTHPDRPHVAYEYAGRRDWP